MTSSDFYCSTTPRDQMCGWIKIPELGNYSRTHCICRNESVHEAVCSVEMACVLCRLICCAGAQIVRRQRIGNAHVGYRGGEAT